MKKLINFINNIRKSEDFGTFLFFLGALVVAILYCVVFVDAVSKLIFIMATVLSFISVLTIGATMLWIIIGLFTGVISFLVENWKK